MRRLLLIIVTACAACTPERQPVEIPFEIRLNGQTISCDAGIDNVLLTDLRMYVADVRVKDANSEWQPVTLAPDGIWQSGNQRSNSWLSCLHPGGRVGVKRRCAG